MFEYIALSPTPLLLITQTDLDCSVGVPPMVCTQAAPNELATLPNHLCVDYYNVMCYVCVYACVYVCVSILYVLV